MSPLLFCVCAFLDLKSGLHERRVTPTKIDVRFLLNGHF